MGMANVVLLSSCVTVSEVLMSSDPWQGRHRVLQTQDDPKVSQLFICSEKNFEVCLSFFSPCFQVVANCIVQWENECTE